MQEVSVDRKFLKILSFPLPYNMTFYTIFWLLAIQALLLLSHGQFVGFPAERLTHCKIAYTGQHKIKK
jgi:hypothetical protein